MIYKNYKDSEIEIVIQQDDITKYFSVAFIKNDREVDFQSKLDLESAIEIFDYWFEKSKGFDMSGWQGAIE